MHIAVANFGDLHTRRDNKTPANNRRGPEAATLMPHDSHIHVNTKKPWVKRASLMKYTIREYTSPNSEDVVVVLRGSDTVDPSRNCTITEYASGIARIARQAL